MSLTVAIDDIRAAADRLRGIVPVTPVVQAPAQLDVRGGHELWLKLENLHEVGSFKVRGACNAVAALSPRERRQGVYTASAGNMAQGLAYAARRYDMSCTVIVPESAPQAKVDAAQRLGAEVLRLPREQWWQVLVDHEYPALQGRAFVHPFADRQVIAGQGTIGLELGEQLPGLQHAYASVGGGGLAAGIGLALQATRPSARTWGVDVTTAPALSTALRLGEPAPVQYAQTFIDGMGSPGITEPMWPLLRQALSGCLVVDPSAVAVTLTTLLMHGRVLAEGAGAAAVAAAATAEHTGIGAAVVSGGCIDSSVLVSLLREDALVGGGP